jgi:hypothetical protein
MVIMIVGWALCFFLLPAHHVRRSDGSRVAPKRAPSRQGHWWEKFTATAKAEVIHILQLKDEPRVLFLIPMCKSKHASTRRLPPLRLCSQLVLFVSTGE